MPATEEPACAATTGQWRAAEFFAGIGLARLGMSQAGIDVVWSNDISATKHAMYERNFAPTENHTFVLGDLGEVAAELLPRNVDLAWASFPCTDLSVAGTRAGLHRGIASSTFWHFVKALSKLGDDRPPVIAIENVTAFATSHSGRDIASAVRAFNGLGYSVDVLSIDARHFVPQSRPRLFLVGTQDPVSMTTEASALRPPWLDVVYDDTSLKTHRMRLPELPVPLSDGLVSYLEPLHADDPRWWSNDRVEACVESLAPVQRERFDALCAGNEVSVRSAYRRMRDGVPRWELRADAIAGCLRTASGGSSKQAVVFLGRNSVRVRWMTPWEYASLMGAPEFPIDGLKSHHAFAGFGDAVCTPVVSWLASNYLVPALRAATSSATPDRSEPVCDLAEAV